MKYREHNIIPQREIRGCDFKVDVYGPSNRLVGSVGRVAEAIELIDQICKQSMFLFVMVQELKSRPSAHNQKSCK